MLVGSQPLGRPMERQRKFRDTINGGESLAGESQRVLQSGVTTGRGWRGGRGGGEENGGEGRGGGNDWRPVGARMIGPGPRGVGGIKILGGGYGGDWVIMG